jgi:hypothetical protein
MHCNHPRSQGLCKVFELGIDRTNEVELLFARPAFELFFPSDGCANVFVTLKIEQALAAAENVDVAAERPWRVRQVRASVVEKLRAAWVR